MERTAENEGRADGAPRVGHYRGGARPLPRDDSLRSADLSYRRLRPGDSGAYRALRLESLARFPESFGATYEEEARVPRLMFESEIETGLSDRFMVGVWSATRLVGLAGFSRRDGRKRSHRGEILQVYVDPEHRGRAVGETVLRTVVEMAFDRREIEQLELSVVSTNVAARRLYAKIGFETYGLLENYFKLGDRRWHQCLMQLTRKRYFARTLETLP